LLEVLKKATARGGMTTSNVSTTDQYRINVVDRDKPAGAIAYAGNTELHYIIEGSANGRDRQKAGAWRDWSGKPISPHNVTRRWIVPACTKLGLPNTT
jgi:hypothetical protein